MDPDLLGGSGLGAEIVILSPPNSSVALSCQVIPYPPKRREVEFFWKEQLKNRKEKLKINFIKVREKLKKGKGKFEMFKMLREEGCFTC